MQPQPQPNPAAAIGIPFDRVFFEQILPGAIGAFCSQVQCDAPVVEVTTIDGVTHYVKGISGVHDAWVALHVSRKEHERPSQVFIPYQTIFRVEIDPCSDVYPRRLGFMVDQLRADAAKLAQAPAAPLEAPHTDQARPAARRRIASK
jgi:hypothetical protein